MNIAMIFAGGRGVRMGSGIPKQFLEIHGKPVLVHTLELFQEHDMIDRSIFPYWKTTLVRHRN